MEDFSMKHTICTAALFILARTVSGQSILNSNLIVNGDAELGSAGTTTTLANIPNWTATGKPNVLPYGLAGYVLSSDPAPPDHGLQYFIGAAGGASTLTQTISVASGAAIISAGNVKFAASAFLGARSGGEGIPDHVTLAFQNASGEAFNTITLGPAGFNGDGMSQQSQIGLVPTGTVQITVTLTLDNTFAVADSLSLILTTLGTSPGTVLGGNLVVNGGAEMGPGVPDTSTAPYIPGWSTTLSASVAPYGGTGWMQTTDPGPADRGVNLFTGPGSSYQDIDVSAAASLIDQAQVTYQISAWLGGLAGFNSPTVTYTFFDWSNTQLATTATLVPSGKVGSELVETAHSAVLPTGTRRVHIAVTFAGVGSMADDISFILAAPSGPPVITAGGIVSAGAFGGFTTIAPGSWIEIYGTNLTASPALQWAGSNFTNGVAPTQLGDVTVTVGGTSAYIDYISPGQVNALVSSSAPVGATEITVTNSLGASAAFPIYVTQTQPGLLAPAAFIVNGKQYVAALFEDGQTFALPVNAIPGVASRPAVPGDTLTIYGVGFGAVTGGFTAGTIVTAQNSLVAPMQFLFNSTSVTPSYDGLAPSFTGLYQFNLTVPNVPANNALPFNFSLGSAKGTQGLYIAVGN
jgi:uncharacterized protein (TIGR03437 family)